MRLPKSRTETTPVTTRVSVDLQRSSTSHLVPTTVAALCLPWVLKLPLPSPHSLRFFLPLAAMLALPPRGQRSFSTSLSVVSGFAARFWAILKMPS